MRGVVPKQICGKDERMSNLTPEDLEFENDDADDTVYPERGETVREFLDQVPVLSPVAISNELEKLGYKGQLDQRRALSLMAYRHIRRLKRIHLDGESPTDLPPKQNVLMLGPTGCGKTFMVELLFQNILKLPTVIVDITSFTESGYIGDDVRTILTRLILNADGNQYVAECGVVCLDEFDKIASSSSNSRFAGQGTTKDVSGYGVQRELLGMMHGADVVVALDYGFSEYGHRVQVSTRDISFIGCGAFSGMDELLRENRNNIGFRNAADDDLSQLTLDEVASFQKFGFLPELIGRFSRIISFPRLSTATLKQILVENVVPQFTNEFKGEGLELIVTEAALDHLVKRSEKRDTGARGLQTELVAAVERAAFETFMQTKDARVVIDVDGGKLTSEVS